ncbi:MAG: hypothetical protein JXA77_15045 [Bacteroidales bacterium]|nr:hypothetical protein [Bacteroidales bacterium]MBN2818928.1 hypothetical protein [Bacteroidales bacterium]
MKILILYASRKGWTQKSAETMSDYLNTLERVCALSCNLRMATSSSIKIEEFDILILGCSIMAGFWKPGTKKFLKRNKHKINKLALYVSAGATLEKANRGKCSLEEAVNLAISKYIDPVKKKYKINTILDGAFGGQYDSNGRIIFNSWKKEDVITWTQNLVSNSG